MHTGEFHSKVLSKARSSQDLQVYKAALEWDLTDPIVIESSSDFKSTPRWKDKLSPYHHQVSNLITFCRRLPVTLLADDVGLGKTISAGLIASELIARQRLNKILVVCPKLLAPQWKEELETKFDLPALIASGKELIEADPEEIGAVITTYNSARMYLEKIPEDRFEMLILDEAHKLRNLYGVENAPQVAKKFREALQRRRFRYVLMLTATPIQNRLWDLYSLVDLLTVARGHENPFGSEGLFARKFIADRRDQARQIKPEARDEFRSIVYGYMSRMRRGDAKLYFPDRRVELQRVEPTPAEIALIKLIAKPILKLNRLAQISILQALTSSPQALSAQLQNMARNQTISGDVAVAVKEHVSSMGLSAKLVGLGQLIAHLKKKSPDWRLVVFTGRRETQTTIQVFLEELGLKVGLINGESGAKNQETLKRFRSNPPECRVIVSTEAGSEGVNLQVANIVVNYDLPWNPMIVEQRIGRVQRLASQHAYVSIFNIVLRGTFEEYIVGRLMEKLQMATHAIGDIEALLQGSDIGESEEGGASSFENTILKLVLAALAGKDYEKETRLAEKSIEEAKIELEREEAAINEMLGSMDGHEYKGPRAPKLPPTVRSMSAETFTLCAFESIGAKVSSGPHGLSLVEENGSREYVRWDDQAQYPLRTTLYSPGSVAFQRLVGRMIASGIHEVKDLELNTTATVQDAARNWADSIGAHLESLDHIDARRTFSGNALVRARVNVAHDSYERLVEVVCRHEDHRKETRKATSPVPYTLEDPALVGLDKERVVSEVGKDPCIQEFSRFYLERRNLEVQAASGDARKQKKLEDDFTPRLRCTLVALTGQSYPEVRVRAKFSYTRDHIYDDVIVIASHSGAILEAPELELCAKTAKNVPRSTLAECEISHKRVLRHFLMTSEFTQRRALPEHSIICGLSGMRILMDEAEPSAVTQKLIARSLLKTSPLSGKKAEPEYFKECDFSKISLLTTELAYSEVSGRLYRMDEQMRSSVSGKTGHKQEFISCASTGQPLLHSEAEECAITHHRVRPGILKVCEVTGTPVLPSELGRCSYTGKSALKELLVSSSISRAHLLRTIAVRSSLGFYCSVDEAQKCAWTGKDAHPEDIRVCSLTGLRIDHNFVTPQAPHSLRLLVDLLNGNNRTADRSDDWLNLQTVIARTIGGGKSKIEAAVLSPTKDRLAVCVEIKTLLGLRTKHVGAVIDLALSSVLGRPAEGRRTGNSWSERRS